MILPLVLNLCQIHEKEHPCKHFVEQVIHGENPGHVIFWPWHFFFSGPTAASKMEWVTWHTQKKNIGIGRIREPVTVKTTTTTKDFNRPCSISSKLTASFYVVSFLLLKRKNDNILVLPINSIVMLSLNIVYAFYGNIQLSDFYITLSRSTREKTFDYTSKGLT